MRIIDESEKFQSLGIIIIFSIKFFDHYGVQEQSFVTVLLSVPGQLLILTMEKSRNSAMHFSL